MKYFYQTYGLSVSSEIPFPELSPLNEESRTSCDVVVRIGEVPSKESINGTQKPFSAYNANEFWYSNPTVAAYYVKDGSEIIIQPLGGADEEVRLFFLSNALGALLYQRNYFLLHASGVIADDDGVILFTAPSRTGKSTLLYQLIKMGCKPFTDDVCVIQSVKDAETNTTAILATASYPVMKLWGDTLKRIEDNDLANSWLLRPGIDKYGVDFSDKFCLQPLKVKGIIVLELDKSSNEISIERLSGVASFQAVEKNTYRRQWMTGMNKSVVHFKGMVELANNVPIYRAKRPIVGDTIVAFAKAIKEEIIDGRR